MRYLLLSLTVVLAACAAADYPWKIPPGKEAQFNLDRHECDRISTEAHPDMLPVVPESMRGDLEALQEAIYKRCMHGKGYQIAK
jgi:hypothetical protein